MSYDDVCPDCKKAIVRDAILDFKGEKEVDQPIGRCGCSLWIDKDGDWLWFKDLSEPPQYPQ